MLVLTVAVLVSVATAAAIVTMVSVAITTIIRRSCIYTMAKGAT
jgi:hypothetical protein